MRTVFFLGFVVCSLLVAGFAYADPNSPAELTTVSTGGRILGGDSNGTIQAIGGNVSEINIEAITITNSYHGYYGNVTGNFRLDDANNNSFYTWGNASILGEVYASRNDTIIWSQINCTNGTERATEETYLGQFASDGDSLTNTYNNTDHPSFLVGLVNITEDSCYSTNMNVNGTSQNESFFQMLLSDNQTNIVYSTLIEDDLYAFNGQIADFQLMVGENEKPGNEGPTTYYFFVELA